MSESRVVRLNVRFEDRSEAATCLQNLRRIPGTSVNVVRGRITPEEAHYEIEIRGQGRLMEQAIWSLWKLTRLLSRAQAELQEV